MFLPIAILLRAGRPFLSAFVKAGRCCAMFLPIAILLRAGRPFLSAFEYMWPRSELAVPH
jgi:hypothetical protein